MKVLVRLGVEDDLIQTGIKPQCYISRAWDSGAVTGVVPARNWDSDAALMPSSRDGLMVDFAGFHEDLQRVLRVTDNVSVWPIFDCERDDRWSGMVSFRPIRNGPAAQ